MIPDRSDAAVIGDSISDPACFATIFDRHFVSVHGYVSRRAGRAVADELTGDVFLAAFEARTRYDSHRPDARPWLFGIATHLVARRHRTTQRQSRAYERSAAAGLQAEDTFDRVDRRIDAAHDVRGLKAVIAGLNADDRDVLLLFAWEGLSYEEIAAALAVPVGTVKSRLHRARRIVREHLETFGAIPGHDVDDRRRAV